MRSATALRACIRQVQPRLALRQLANRRLAGTMSGTTTVQNKDPATGARVISYAAPSEPELECEGSATRHPPPRFKYFNFRLSRPLAASLALVFGGTALGVWFPPDLRIAYHPPEEPKITGAAKRDGSSARLEKELAALPVVAALRHDAFERRESDLWREYRHQIPPGPQSHGSMFTNALLGTDKIAILPFVRERSDARESITIVHVGKNLCGHEGIVHGGLVATLFDQYLYRLGIKSLDTTVAATAHLDVDYRAPVRANQFLVLKAQLVEDSVRPNKVTIVGRLEDANGNLLAESKGIFVKPRNTKNFIKSGVPSD